jgi:hypothetical protein
LDGSQETIERCRPIVLVEVRFAARATVEQFFSKLDYRMFFLRAKNLHEMGSGSDLAQSHENFFAVPSDKISNMP